MSFRDFFIHIRGMKHYLIASLGVFLIGVYLGYTEPDRFAFLLEAQTNRLRGVVQGLTQIEHRQWWLFVFIFFNNTIISVLMVYAGAILALPPLFFLLTNGLLLGYLASESVPHIGWYTFLKSIVPHGIIEIPALILACAYGVRFGLLVVESILSFPLRSRRSVNGAKLIRFLRLTFPLAAVLCVLLLIAAVIESTVTYNLVK